MRHATVQGQALRYLGPPALVVTHHKAMYKGVGTINGSGEYGFILTAIDEKLTSSTDVDLFRIKI